jgi:hypothetical protein
MVSHFACAPYRLGSEIMGIVRNNQGKPAVALIPSGAVVEVVSQELADGTLDVRWKDQLVNIFAIDLGLRAKSIE